MMNNSEIVQMLAQHLDDAAFVAACRADVKSSIESIVDWSHDHNEPVDDIGEAVEKDLADNDGEYLDFLFGLLPDADVEALCRGGDDLYEVLQRLADDKGFANIGELVANVGWDEKLAQKAQPFTFNDLRQLHEDWEAEARYMEHDYYRSRL